LNGVVNFTKYDDIQVMCKLTYILSNELIFYKLL